jgi:putative N6-adenine-specific DNA methylase
MRAPAPPRETGLRFYGSDRDPGAIRMARENAERAGVFPVVRFEQQSVETLSPPDGPPGLIIINPPYGTRIGNKAPLLGLYRTMGNVIRAKFAGWRVGIVTTDKELAKATGLGLELVEPTVLHGGLRVGLWRT